jgi:hypothetical protein
MRTENLILLNLVIKMYLDRSKKREEKLSKLTLELFMVYPT